MEKIIFQVGGLKCGACESSIKKKLQDTRGVGAVKPDRGESKVEVEYDPAMIDVEGLKRIIIDDGLNLEG